MSETLASTTGDTRQLPPHWERKINPKGRPYYANHKTRTTTWTNPLDAPADLSNPSTTSKAPLSAAEDSSVQLPPHWERAVSAKGFPYFINHKTRTTTWYNPMNPPVEQDPRFPSHYERALDSEGRVYYKNHETHTNMWLNPLTVEEMKTQENQIVHEVTAGGLDYWVDYATGGMLTKDPAEVSGDRKREQWPRSKF